MPVELQGGGNLQTQDGNDLQLQADGGGPVITLHPADLLVFEQAEAGFSGAATSANPVEFDWYVNAVLVASNGGSAYALIASLANDGDSVYFVARDSVTGDSAQSNSATLSVISRPEILRAGELYTASYPDFFPCPTWEYAQGITGHQSRKQFDSGWSRQRKRWRENNTTVDLTFTMSTYIYDKWSRWMVANGYRWFSMYLDRIAGQQVLTEIRLISKMRFKYAQHDQVVVTVMGELGAGAINYGPTGEPPATGTPGVCVPVYFEEQIGTIETTEGAIVSVSTVVNSDATEAIEYSWYKNGDKIAGETESSLTFTVDSLADRYAVRVSNPCGEDTQGFDLTGKIYLECSPYSETAFDDALQGISPDAMWRFDDPIGSSVIAATAGSDLSITVGTPVFERASMFDDGRTSTQISGATKMSGAGDGIFGGVFGAVVDSVSGSTALFTQDLNESGVGASSVRVWASQVNGVQVTASNNGPAPTGGDTTTFGFPWPGGGGPYLVEVEFEFGVDDVTVSCWINCQFIGTSSYTFDDVIVSPNSKPYYIGGAGSGSCRIQYAWFRGSGLTSDGREAICIGKSRNDEDYTPPNWCPGPKPE